MTYVHGTISGNISINDTIDTFELIISCLKEILKEQEDDSGRPIKKICLKHGIDYSELVQLLNSKPFKNIDINGLINEVWIKDENPYELLFRDVLGMPYVGIYYPVDLKDTMCYILNTLNEREKKVIKMRYGFDDYTRMTFKEVGEQLNLSTGRVTQIYYGAIEKLRQFKSRELIEYRLIDEKLNEKKKELGVINYKQFYDEALKQYEDIGKESESIKESIVKATALSKTIKLHELGFSTRTYKCLVCSKYNESDSLYDLLMVNNTEFMQIYGFGQNSFIEVNKKLNEFLADFGLNRVKFLEMNGKELVTE